MKKFPFYILIVSISLTGCLGNPGSNPTATMAAQATYTPLPTLTPYPTVPAPTYTLYPTQPAPTAVPPQPTDKPAADYQGTESCQDGKIVSNQYADITRIPIGTLEGAIVAEISWTGSGFGGFDRAVVVVPRMTAQTMAFVLKSRTIHLVQYCGFLKDILNYAPTHVDALVQSSQDDAGNRPDPQEIGVYYVDLDGNWTVVRDGPMGPGLEFVKQHVVMTPLP